MAQKMRYGIPPKSAFRKMGLGELVNGRIKVVAGFRFPWWRPDPVPIPLVVYARVLKLKVASEVPRA